MSAFSTMANTSNNNRALSLPTLDGANSNANFSKQLHRVIVMDDEDSRECPSQGVCEIAREGFFLQGVDERRGHGDGIPLKQQTIVARSPRNFFHRRAVGHCGQNCRSFRERRDSNSFDTYDSDSDDDNSTLHHRMLPIRHQGKKQLQMIGKPNLPTPPTMILDNGSGTGNNQGAPPLVVRVDAVNNNNKRTKRKTPSPILGEEPASVSVVAPSTDNSMDTSEDGTLHTQETCDTTEAGYESDNGDNMLPSPGRRVSLSPISRRLAIQFDSISFLSPVKPSRTKRRKTLDTSASCFRV